MWCFGVFHFSEPFTTDVGPASHEFVSGEEGLRALRGRPELFDGLWLLLWSRGELAGHPGCRLGSL